MLMNQYAFIAFDLARERVAEAEARHRFADALDRPARPGAARRALARAAVGVSRASASVARRLDAAAIEPEALDGRPTVA